MALGSYFRTLGSDWTPGYGKGPLLSDYYCPLAHAQAAQVRRRDQDVSHVVPRPPDSAACEIMCHLSKGRQISRAPKLPQSAT